jgi:branched-chain amino acid transport system permease protein
MILFNNAFLKTVWIALVLGFYTGISQAQSVSGVVTDAESGITIPGVNIIVQGTNIGTATDVNGQYELSVPSLNETLIVSFVGYLTQEIEINGRTTIDIELRTQALLGDELVVIGYGTQRRAELTGSIGSVSERDFNRGHLNSPEELMQGKISGVNITTVSGQPGSPQSVIIRGPGTIRAGSGPLYVIDGVAIDNTADTTPTGESFGPGSPSNTNPLAFLNPNDIESIDVLKDASATAIYGARGANGVVLMPVFFLLGILIYRFYYETFERRGTEAGVRGLAFFFGIAFIIEVGLILVFGVDQRTVHAPYIGNSLALGDYRIPFRMLVAFGVALVLTAALTVYLSRTFMGRAIKAVAQDEAALRLMGANPVRVKQWAFGIATGVTALAGAMLIIVGPVEPALDRLYIGRTFAIVVLAGLGSMTGPLGAGLILGISESIVLMMLGASWAPAVAFGLLLLVLGIRPQGLFGR